jgi:hypothetical protein
VEPGVNPVALTVIKTVSLHPKVCLIVKMALAVWLTVGVKTAIADSGGGGTPAGAAFERVEKVVEMERMRGMMVAIESFLKNIILG